MVPCSLSRVARLIAVAFAAVQCLGCLASLVYPRASVHHADADFYLYKDDVVLFPISYSIPAANIVDDVPDKTRFAVNDSRNSFQFKNYSFGPLQEHDYHMNIRRHRFGDTRKKGGFDCLRHYELIANGCLPVFAGLADLPPTVMRTLSRPLLREAERLFALPWSGTDQGPGDGEAAGAYDSVVKDFLQLARHQLTTEAAAEHVLKTLGIPKEGIKVLFLPCSSFDHFPSYLAASVFHGFVSLLGDNIIDVPEYDYAYELNAPDDEIYDLRSRIWGQGFTLGFKLPRRPHLDRGNISARIRRMEFDLIVFARMSPYEPCNFWYEFQGVGLAAPQYFQDVYETYPRERVALLYGDDSGLDDAVVRSHVRRTGALHRGIGLVFMREMLPFVSDGGPSDVLRPVDGRLLQPGCFYAPWLDFFERWHDAGGGLRACVVWGRCDSPDVIDYLELREHVYLPPPVDGAVLQQFCRTGFALQAALLVQRLDPDGCGDDALCSRHCRFALDAYSQGLLDAPPEAFHDEFGLTGVELVYVLSQACAGASLALQPAAAELPGQRREVAIVFGADDGRGAAATPDVGSVFSLRSAGGHAGEWQVRYLVAQGYLVHLLVTQPNGSESIGDADFAALPPRLQPLAAHGLLRLARWSGDEDSSSAGEACDWSQPLAGRLALLHVDLFSSTTAAASATSERTLRRCLGKRVGWPPPFVYAFGSVQLPRETVRGDHEDHEGELAADGVALRALRSLLAAGYRRFKATRHAPGGLGGPFGAAASDAVAGPRWRSAEELLANGGPPAGGQLHATV